MESVLIEEMIMELISSNDYIKVIENHRIELQRYLNNLEYAGLIRGQSY